MSWSGRGHVPNVMTNTRSALPFLKDSIFVLCEYTCTDSLNIQDREQRKKQPARRRSESQIVITSKLERDDPEQPDSRPFTHIRTSNSDNIAHHWRALVLVQFHSHNKLEKDDSWHTLEAFSARCQKLLEDMKNAEEVQCCRDRDTPTNHKDYLDGFR